jgi:hypothetical protein
MDTCTLAASTRWRTTSRVLATVLLMLNGFGMRGVSAEECGPHCDPRIHPSQYSDPRCESRRTGSRLDRDELRCDTRGQPRRADHPLPPTKPPLGPFNGPSAGQMPAVSPADAGPPPRAVERDVGFDDAFITQGNAAQAAGAAGGNPGAAGAGAGANPGGAAAAAAGPSNPGAAAAAAAPGASRASSSRR